MSPMFHLEGTNELASLKEPSTVLLNGNDQATPYIVPVNSRQMNDFEEHLPEAPLEENNFSTDSSLFDTDEMESFRDSAEDKEDANKGDVAFTGDEDQTTSYDAGYLNQSSEEDESEPSRAMVEYKNYDSNYMSNADSQGLPTLSSIIASRLKAKDALSSFGLGHSATSISNYAMMAKQLSKNKHLAVENPLELHSVTTATKKDNSTNVDMTADEGDDRESDDAKKKQYKAMLKNAETAANLAETAKTLTKLVKKLTEHEVMMSRKQGKEIESRRNDSKAATGGGWSPWSKWSSCSATCGGGFRYTKRNCSSLSSSHGIHHCSGRHIRVRMCNLYSCNAVHDKKVDLERSLREMAEARSNIYKP
ncbi:uncharacterized protein [Porites lutea]|uniref:uncharacterized protein n=1 Tax=Porites lutea TaxID=51062 RepID=UPI003CC62085